MALSRVPMAGTCHWFDNSLMFDIASFVTKEVFWQHVSIPAWAVGPAVRQFFLFLVVQSEPRGGQSNNACVLCSVTHLPL
jgi:hypothetical protein